MIGKTISHYQILELLGKGGMGVVYKAKDTKLDRTVALKFLPPSMGSDEDKARFLIEAQSAAKLEHPNICTIHEINEADGQTFIAMAFVDGPELREVVKAGQVPLADVVHVASQVAAALQDAHDHNIIHRDIKSANVMIDRRGTVKVMDFGLAKQTGQSGITVAGSTLGTADYMSPEQARGESVDHRSDLWSLGVVLYEMIAGKLPFSGSHPQAAIYSILNEEPKPFADQRDDIPEKLIAIVTKALNKNPAERFQSGAEFLAELQEVQQEVGAPSGVTGRVSGITGGYTGGVTASMRPVAPGGGNLRRAILFVGAYLVIAAVALFGVNMLIDRFPVSPHLPKFTLAALICLLPTVFLLGFARGSATRIGVPANILMAAAVLFVAFQGKDLGAATARVSVTDSEGNVIEREIPKGEFRKRVAIFYFDDRNGKGDNWLSYAIPQLTRADWSQDTYMVWGLGFTRRHTEAGFPYATGSPTQFKRQLANEFHYQYFVHGSFTENGEALDIVAKVHETKSGRVVAEHRYTGTDLFSIVDSLSTDVRRALDIPDYHISENPDLPVSEIFTNSRTAMENYIMGVNAIYQRNDYAASAEYLEKAVGEVPAFANAHWLLSDAYNGLNDGEKATSAIRAAVDHKYNVSESMRFALMADYYGLRQDADAAFANAQRWASLYPGDPGGHQALASYYQQEERIDEAIAERRIVFELDPERYSELLNIASLYERKGDFDNALTTLEEYRDLFPDDYDSYNSLGGFHRRRGEYDQARTYYKKALLLEPEKLFLRTNLAAVERHTGNFDESLQQCLDALKNASTAQEKGDAYGALQVYYNFRGEFKKALEYQEKMFAEREQTWAPVQLLSNRIFATDAMVQAGQAEAAFAFLRGVEEKPMVPWLRSIVDAGYLIAYNALDDPANLPDAQQRLTKFSGWVEQANMNSLQWAVDVCQSMVHRWEGNGEAALKSAASAAAKAPANELDTFVQMHIVAGISAYELSRYTEAEEYLQKAVALEPFQALAHFLLARVYQAQGDLEKARFHIDRAAKVYENGDEENPWVKGVRELAKELRTTS